MTYRRALFLADALRRADLMVVEEPGWQTRGRPVSSGSFDPVGFLLHHDASAVGRSVPGGKDVVRDGRSDLPGPLSQLYYSFGTFYVLAAGRANHAGTGGPWGQVAADLGNARLIGCEWDHTTGEPVSARERTDLARGAAAVLDALGSSPYSSALGHREWAPHRKTDPDGIDLDSWRHEIAAQIADLRADRNLPVRPASPASPLSPVSRKKVPRMLILVAPGKPVALFVPGSSFEPISNAERAALMAGGVPSSNVTAAQWATVEAVAKRLHAHTS